VERLSEEGVVWAELTEEGAELSSEVRIRGLDHLESLPLAGKRQLPNSQEELPEVLVPVSLAPAVHRRAL
jgi:hypothetical protein